MSTPKDAPYKLAQQQAPKPRYLVVEGIPPPDSPLYVLRVQKLGGPDGQETGRRKLVRKDRLHGR